jgi:hypothetical protein
LVSRGFPAILVFTFVFREETKGVEIRFANPNSPCPFVIGIALVGIRQSDAKF